jgi:hypothetical protein
MPQDGITRLVKKNRDAREARIRMVITVSTKAKPSPSTTLSALDARFIFLRACFMIEPYVYTYYRGRDVCIGQGRARLIMASILLKMSAREHLQLFELRRDKAYSMCRESPHGDTAVHLQWVHHMPFMDIIFYDDSRVV